MYGLSDYSSSADLITVVQQYEAHKNLVSMISIAIKVEYFCYNSKNSLFKTVSIYDSLAKLGQLERC